MSGFGRVLGLEIRRSVNRLIIGLIVIFVIGSITTIQSGIGKYKSKFVSQSKFINVENKKISIFNNYKLLYLIGFRILSNQCPLISLNQNSSASDNLIGIISGDIMIDLNKPQKGGNIFDRPTGGMLDFSWYMLVFGGILIYMFSFYTFKNIDDYVRFLLNFAQLRRVYAAIILTRILLITLFLAIILTLSLLQFILNGIKMGSQDIIAILILFLVTWLLMVFLFLVGSSVGSAKNKLKGGIISVLLFLLLFYLWPVIQNSIISNSASKSMISIYDNEIKKMEIAMKFEKYFAEKLKEYQTSTEKLKASREMFENYWNNEFKQIENLELENINQTEALVKRFQLWSIFNPVTFYKSVTNEIGSSGYNSYLLFYREVMKKQKAFKKFYIDKRFYENDPKVEPFLKDGEYIFHAQSSLPHYFGMGFGLLLIYVLLALGFSFFRFKRMIFTLPEQKDPFRNLELKFSSGEYLAYSPRKKGFADQLFNLFIGSPVKFSGKISMDGDNIVSGERQNFVYLPDPVVIPGNIKTRIIFMTISKSLHLESGELKDLEEEFYNILSMKWEDVDPVERVKMLLKLFRFKNPKIYLLKDFFLGIHYHVLGNIVKGFKSKDILVLEILSLTSPQHDKFNRYYMVSLEHSGYEFDTIDKLK